MRVLVLLSLVIVTSVLTPVRSDESSKANGRAPLPAKLKQPVRLADFHSNDAYELLKQLERRLDVQIGFDFEELQEASKGTLKGIQVPSSTLPLAVSLELVANQMHGTLRRVREDWRIVRGPPELTRFLTPTTSAKRVAYASVAKLDRPIRAAPGREIVEYFSEKFGVAIWIVPKPLGAAGEPLEQVPCNLQAGEKPLLEWIRDLAKQLKAEVLTYEEVILIAKEGQVR
jgi:hypothetical protein